MTEKQALYMLFLAAEAGTAPWKSRLPVSVERRDRERLQRDGLLVSRKAAKGAYVVELTDAGWAWVGDNLKAPLPRRTTAGALVLSKWLHRLSDYLQRERLPVAELFMGAEAASAPDADAADNPDGTDRPGGADTSAQVHRACLALADGRTRVRLRVADIRARLPALALSEVHAALERLAAEGALHLVPFDDPREVTAADRAAAVRIAGESFGLVYLE